ncbi:hypothetical protein [Nostoc sp. C052]|nr:hypothetical protein [Nostoc sp. C052]
MFAQRCLQRLKGCDRTFGAVVIYLVCDDTYLCAIAPSQPILENCYPK